MKKNKNLSPTCPIRTTLEMLGGKWRLLIISEIGSGSLRYGEIKRAIPEISEKMLTQELKTLVDNNLVVRYNYGEVPPRVDYSLTENGEKALQLIEPIRDFGLQYIKK
ncbi:winged helix-turn-helix transcriptional regulator [Tunicatimonas pelagia]|uniref:winged helix-turn-helix transcriptional regulator n=1 Tax=Tunicatimonas pelagia TaxID=931531 RepID=UPI002665D585|nr:helix-turn-helix domain-containing protein [Tunicatimonas pelagia]WKN40429.1 helix-turn-helix domain-containing protein [Tunicatimonas pelagia]